MGLESLDSFLQEYDKQSAQPDFDSTRFSQDFEQGLGTSGRNKIQPETAKGLKSKGFLQETASAVAGGVTDAAELWMRAVRAVDPEGGNDVIRDFATSGIDAVKNFVSRHPSLSPDNQVQEGVKRWWIEGVRALIPSLSASVPGIIGGAAFGAVTGVGIGAVPGAAIGGAALSGAVFGLAEFDKFHEEVEEFIVENQLSEEEAINMREEARTPAIFSAITEGGLEAAANALQIRTLGRFIPGRAALKNIATQPINKLFKKSAGQIAKETGKTLALTTPVEVGTEFAQAALETKFRRDIGLTDASSMEAGFRSMGPAFVTNLLFFGAGRGANSFQRYSIRKNLEDAKVNPNARKKAVREIANIVRATGEPNSEAIAEQLESAGNRFINEGIQINLNTEIGMQNMMGTYLESLQEGELSLKQSKKYVSELQDSLDTEQLSTQETIKRTQLIQGLSTINTVFEINQQREAAAKPKVKKRKATASDKLRDLGDAATIKGKAPVVRETVEEEAVEAPEALEELAEEVTAPKEVEAEIPVEEEPVAPVEEKTEAELEREASVRALRERREEVTGIIEGKAPPPAKVVAEEEKPVEAPKESIIKGVSLQRAEELTGLKDPSTAQIKDKFENMSSQEQQNLILQQKKEVTESQNEIKNLLTQRKEAFVPDKPIFTSKIRAERKLLSGRERRLKEFEQQKKTIPEEAVPAEPVAREPFETSELATTPDIPVSRVRAKKQPDGTYKLFFRGTANEVFEGQTFKTAPEARAFFSEQKIKAQEAFGKEPVAPEAKEEIEEVEVPEAVPVDVTKELETVEAELDDATAVFVRAETKGKAKREAKTKVEALQAQRKKLRIAAGIELNVVDQAKKNITDKFGTLNLGADPTILKDMTVVGAHHFNSGLKTFTSWSKAMINDLGKSVKSFLRRVWRSVRRGGIPTDETTELQAQAVKIEKEQHPEKEMQVEQIKTVEDTSKTIKEGKTEPSIIGQMNNFITHNPYNVLHDDKSKNDVKNIFSDIQDEDISTFSRVTGLPYWKAKKFVEWQRSVGIEIKRTESKNLLKFELGKKVFNRSEVDEGSRADVHEFFALKGDSVPRVSAVILEGDARRKEFTDKNLKEGITTTELDKVTDEYKAFRGKSIKLNAEEITAYRAWQVTMKKVRRLMVTANEDLLYKPYQGKPWVADLRKVVANKAEQIQPVQAVLGLEAQKEESVVVPELTARDIPAGLSEAEQKAFTKAYNTVIKPKGRIQELRKQMGELKGYVPHLRDEGTIKVSFVDKDGQTRDSNIFKNKRQAAKWIEERQAFHKARGNDYTVSTPETVARTPEFLYQQVTASALERFSNKAFDRLKASKEGKAVGKITTEDLEEIRAAMKQALSDELSARGFGERTLKRTRGPNIGGYRVDNLKDVLAGYISGASGFMTKMEAAYEQGQLLSEIDVKKKPKLYEEISIYGRNMMRNLTRSDQISSKIRTTAFMWYLSGQLKSPAVNFTQNWILGIPVLAKFTTGARRKYNRAMFDISTNRTSDVEKKALLEAGKRGITGDQLMQDIFGQMQENTNKSVQTVIKILSFPFSASEILNRKFAFLARFRAGIEKGESFDQAFDGAREFVFDVHFLYGKENQALIASGGTPFSNAIRTSLTFRNYTFNYLNAMKNHIGDKNFALVGRSMAYMALLGGLSSLPFLDDFLDMWERFTGIPIRKKIQQELKGVGGDVLAVVGTQGLPALVGVDLSGSLRIHLPDPTDPARLFEESVFGVYEGLAVKAKDSIKSILDGEPLRALERGAPIFLEKPLKAWRVSRDGKVTTKTGKTIFTAKGRPLTISTREAITQAIGFRPSKLAFESGKFRQFMNVEANFRNRRTRLFRRLRFVKTAEEKREVLKAIQEYNKEARDLKGGVPLITSESISRATKEIPSKRFRAFSR